MLALLLAPVYIAANVYLIKRILRWMSCCHAVLALGPVKVIFVILFSILAVSLLAAFLITEGPLVRPVNILAHYWMGVELYLTLTVLFCDLARVCLRLGAGRPLKEKELAILGGVGALCLIAVCVYGIIHAGRIYTTPYQVTVHKDGGRFDRLNIVLAADLHMGYLIGAEHIRTVVDAINECRPDLVVLAGDLFDNDYNAIESPERLKEILSSIRSRYGVYAVYGNHDIQEKILAGFTFGKNEDTPGQDPRMDEFLKDCNVRLLSDEGIMIADSLYLYGRPDAQRPGRQIARRRSAKEITERMNRELPIIILDHQPREQDELAAAGVDLDLCGHTHDGQLFPANLITRSLWRNSCGYLQAGQMHNIVTSGAGLFGPYMRVGTNAEICRIRVDFRKQPKGAE